MTDLLWVLFIFIAFVTGFVFGVQRERRHWTRTIDSRTGKPRLRV